MNKLYIIILSVFLSATAFAQEKNTASSAAVKDTCTVSQADSAPQKGIEQSLSEGSVEIYNLCGKFITNDPSKLKKGVYIAKQKGTSRKMVVK